MTAAASAPREDELAVASRWWLVALVVTVVACGAVAAIELATAPVRSGRLWLSLGAMAAYVVFFALVARTARVGSARAWASVAVTIAAAGAFTAIFPVNAVFQFWMYPLVWVLTGTVSRAVFATFLAAAAVFVGFGIGAAGGSDWVMGALLTQVVSFAASIVMGLWIAGIYRYAREREALLAELTAAQDEVAALHREAGTTAERERLSRELHDTIAQSLAGAVLLAQRARRELAAGMLTPATLELVEDAAHSALAETRALVAGTAPVELRGGGISEALAAIAARFARETDLPVAVHADADPPLAREAEVALLRCAQEALSNVRRHAGATGVTVSLAERAGAAELRVVDDGRGFDPSAASHGFGLEGLRSRVALVGGSVEVDGTPGAVTLLARVPVGDARPADASEGQSA